MGKALIEETDAIPVGDVRDFRNFMGAVITEKAFNDQSGYIARARKAKGVKILAGGKTDGKKGWFVRPTLIQADDPRYETMCEEIFGPIVSVHVYPDERWAQTLGLVDSTSPYALTGAVFATERAAIQQAADRLRHAAGNFYVNDKPTGAVVGQQPFGGGRASGTNDKAGSAMNLLRWVSARSIKETLVPPTAYRYPVMEGKSWPERR
jgi:1-pyrroline-5-carboxylate dehydrogenase